MTKRNNRRIHPSRPRFAFLHWLRLHLRTLVVAMLFAGSTLGGGWWLNETLSVTTWRIAGADIRLHAKIDDILNNLPQTDFWHARPTAVREILLAGIPDLADVEITRQLPGILHLRAIPRTPVAFWQAGDGTVRLVDDRGVDYRPIKKHEVLDLPILRVQNDELANAVRLLELLAHHDSGGLKNLSELCSQQDAWKLYFSEGGRWLLPRGTEAFLRLQAVAALQKKSRWRNQAWRIDARMGSRWFIRPARQGGVI